METEQYNLLSIILVLAVSFGVPFFLSERKQIGDEAVSKYKESETAKTLEAIQRHQEESNKTIQAIRIQVELLNEDNREQKKINAKLTNRVAHLEGQNDK